MTLSVEALNSKIESPKARRSEIPSRESPNTTVLYNNRADLTMADNRRSENKRDAEHGFPAPVPLARNASDIIHNMPGEKKMVVLGLVVVVMMSLVGGISTTIGVNKLMQSISVETKTTAVAAGSVRRRAPEKPPAAAPTNSGAGGKSAIQAATAESDAAAAAPDSGPEAPKQTTTAAAEPEALIVTESGQTDGEQVEADKGSEPLAVETSVETKPADAGSTADGQNPNEENLEPAGPDSSAEPEGNGDIESANIDGEQTEAAAEVVPALAETGTVANQSDAEAEPPATDTSVEKNLEAVKLEAESDTNITETTMETSGETIIDGMSEPTATNTTETILDGNADPAASEPADPTTIDTDAQTDSETLQSDTALEPANTNTTDGDSTKTIEGSENAALATVDSTPASAADGEGEDGKSLASDSGAVPDITANTTGGEIGALTSPDVGSEQGASPQAPQDDEAALAAAVSEAPKDCEAPREGIIVSNLLGRLFQNLLQVGFSKLMSEQLCWPLVYRAAWIGQIVGDRAACFPNAGIEGTGAFVSPELQTTLNISHAYWNDSLKPKGRVYNDEFNAVVKRLEESGKGIVTSGESPAEFFEGPLAKIRDDSSPIQFLKTEGFFENIAWMEGNEEKLRNWLTVDDTCCQTDPENAIVVHMSEDSKVQPAVSVYVQILENAGYSKDRPILIVPESKKAAEGQKTKDLVEALGDRIVNVYSGGDQFEQFCALSRAKTLVLSPANIQRQFVALVSGSKDVHCPVHILDKPSNTLGIKALGWKYHLMGESLDTIEDFDVNPAKLTFA